jgi:hypothetical protein
MSATYAPAAAAIMAVDDRRPVPAAALPGLVSHYSNGHPVDEDGRNNCALPLEWATPMSDDPPICKSNGFALQGTRMEAELRSMRRPSGISA